MSVTSHFPLAGNVLLLLKSDLREQQRELMHAIDKAQKEIRALADSESGDVIDDYSGNASKEAIFASYCNVFPQAILASALSVGMPSVSNGCKLYRGRTTVSSARSNPSKAESIE
jgi:hypothetical protein